MRQANFTALKSSFGNYLLAIIKFLAFKSTGSASMNAEALHSFNDGSAQLAVFVGSIFASRKPSPAFPNGFGRLSNLFVLFVAIFMAYNSIHAMESSYQAIFHPNKPSGYLWNMLVLLISLAVDGYVLFQAMKDINLEAESEAKGLDFVKVSFQKYHLASPETRLVFFEDLVATAAIFIAMLGITLSHLGLFPSGDGIAGLVISVLLMGIAVEVAWENIKGLIGYTAPGEVVEEIAEAIMNVDGVEDLYDLDVVREGSYLDVDGTIELPEDMSVADAEFVKNEIKRRLKGIYPNIHNVTLGIHENDELSRYASRKFVRLKRKKTGTEKLVKVKRYL